MTDLFDASADDPGQHAFGRRYRLTHPAEFDAVFREGRRSADRLFTILARPNDLDHSRLGLAISRKRIRAAHARNRIRRLTRESFRMARFGFRSSDIVVMATPAAAGASNAEIFASLRAHWDRLSRPRRRSSERG